MAAEFRLLGPVEATVVGRPVDLGHVRQRCVLAVLLVEPNTPVSMHQLVDRIWGDRAPRQAASTLYSYLSRLRRCLADIDGVELARDPAGYLVAVDPTAVDLHRFRHLVRAARQADPQDAVALFDQALHLWRGEPFAGVDSVWLGREREAAVGERLAAELDRADLALALGQHAMVLAELGSRATAHPFDERIAGQLMLALYRCGRQADALDHYERVRRLLADELGTDPGPALQRLHQEILMADPALTLPGDGRVGLVAGAERPASRLPGAAVPRQLPAPPPVFTGRADQLAELTKAMAATAEAGATVVISAIGGGGGVGKTALSLHWAHDSIDRFPDGQLYVNLRGFDPTGEPLRPEVALRGLLETLGVPTAHIPAQLDAQSALYRSVTAGKRMLVLLDNARDSEQVVSMLPNSSGCAVLVTSRNALGGLVTGHGARPMVLDVLTRAEAHELLERRLGAARVAAEPEALAALLDHCAGLPIALGIVSARAALQPALPLSALAEQLQDASTRLDALDAGELTVSLRAVLSCSLAAVSDDAARMLSLLGLAPGPDIGLPALASLVGRPVHAARALTKELIHAHLVQELTPGRYRMHDLVRLFAAEQARKDENRCREAIDRLLDYYQQTAHAAGDALSPGRSLLPLPPRRPGVVAQQCRGHDDALAWFTAERAVLVGAVELAAAEEFDHHAWTLAWTLQSFLRRGGYWHDLLSTQSAALAAAVRLADPVARTHAHCGLANAHIGLSRFDEAHDHLARASELAAGEVPMICRAHVHRGLGRLFAEQGNFDEALGHDERALDLYRAAGDSGGQSSALNAIGWHLIHLGEPAQALARCEQALAICRSIGDRHGQSRTWDSIARARYQLGQYPEAIDCYRQAVKLDRELGYRNHVGVTLLRLGEVYVAARDPAAAAGAYREALRLYEEIGDPGAGSVRERLRQVTT